MTAALTRHITDAMLDDMATTAGHPFHGLAAAVLWHEATTDAAAPEVRSLIRAVCRALLDARPDLAGLPDPLLETRPHSLPGLGQIPAATAHLPRMPPGTWPTYEDAFVHGWAQGVRDVRDAAPGAASSHALHYPIERALRWLRERHDRA